MRLIDKNKYNEDLKKEFIDVQDILDQGFNRGLYKAQSLLDNQPTANHIGTTEAKNFLEENKVNCHNNNNIFNTNTYVKMEDAIKAVEMSTVPKPYEPKKGSE